MKPHRDDMAEVAFDDDGLNVGDPRDTLGKKSQYISTLQEMALARELGSGAGLNALEIGCGFGRLTPFIASLGYSSIGLDPSLRLLRVAKLRSQDVPWCAGALPSLPFRDKSFDLVLLLNVLRPLHLMGSAAMSSDAPRLVADGGRLVVLENIRKKDKRYLDEDWIVANFERCGLRLARRVAIRSGRWPVIYAIRYGLVPDRMFPAIASWELTRMRKKGSAPRFTYHNVIFVFEKI